MINFRQKDKQQHFLGGFVLSFAGSFISIYFGIMLPLIVGYLKEKYDKANPLKHTSDNKDMYATWLGGGFGLLFYCILRNYNG